MILNREIVKKAMQVASAIQKRTIDTADLMIAHGKEFHPLTDKCDFCEKLRTDFLLKEEKGEL